MALVHVIGADFETQRVEDANAGHSQDHLLFQAIDIITAVEDIRDRSIGLRVFGQIRIEQNDRRPATQMTLDDVQPGSDPDSPILDTDSHLGVQLTRPPRRVPVFRPLLLVAPGIELLMKITRPADQGDPDEWQAQVR